ncbi:MAG TPA: hypothetical protein VMG10_20545 [Gemmataceae bacterium]|nr:hypothetical protein [Gemmataceae bacterium]
MQNQSQIHNPSLQRLVQDFDAVADLVQTLIEHDRLDRTRQETILTHEMEFTTEWQMEPAEEEIYLG